MSLDLAFLCPIDDCLPVRNHDGDQAILEAVAIDEDLVDMLVDLIYLLESCWADILAMRQLEYVLDAIDDFDRPIDMNLANVASVDESILVDGSFGLFYVLKVALDGILTSEADFTLW